MQIAGVEITHPDKVLFPKLGITKLEVAKFYEKVSEKMIPYLKGRPLSLVRAPEGVDEFKFYQKHPNEKFPDYIERVKIKEIKGTTGVYIEIDALNDLMYLANLETIEFHAWLSKSPDLEHADICVIDFDPDSEKLWHEVIDGIKFLKDTVEEMGYKPEARATGNKGIHLVFEHKPKTNWTDAKELSKAIAQKLMDHNPEKFTLSLPKVKRKGKIFLDYLRNQRGQTAVVPYSLRINPNASYAKPVKWSEVNYDLKPDQFRLRDVMSRPHS